MDKFEFPYCAKVDKYEKMTKIGQGKNPMLGTKCILVQFISTRRVRLGKVRVRKQYTGHPNTTKD